MPHDLCPVDHASPSDLGPCRPPPPCRAGAAGRPPAASCTGGRSTPPRITGPLTRSPICDRYGGPRRRGRQTGQSIRRRCPCHRTRPSTNSRSIDDSRTRSPRGSSPVATAPTARSRRHHKAKLRPLKLPPPAPPPIDAYQLMRLWRKARIAGDAAAAQGTSWHCASRPCGLDGVTTYPAISA